MQKGLAGIKTIRDFELNDKVLFLRLDLNVPLEDGKITDDTRIQASLPTIQYALEKGAKIVMASHLGRPKAAGDKKYSLEPVAARLTELLQKEVILVEEPDSDGIKMLLTGLKKGYQLILLENVRYIAGETENDEVFAQHLASYSDVYINDAFGASHRAHATIDALPRLMKDRGIGFLIEKEIQMLDRLLVNPQRPYLAVLGGAKVSDKIEVIEKLMDLVDGFVIGGAMAYTFLKAQGIPVGKSLVEVDKLNYAREMFKRMEARNKTLLLPVDHVKALTIKDAKGEVTVDAALEEPYMGVDIGPKTIQLYRTALKEAKTIFWNGPMGVFENPAFSKGTFAVAETLAGLDCLRIVGGGDSAAAAEASGYAAQMSHISTGGGASLEYLQGDRLPGLEVLRARNRG
ncbi:MAG: phosphoglycerate kinase [Proteobacteria bacterium]|jgi:phosphoglycerate kinase|nr:phosphoglycerate kinase [Pseudomonadota bacterium]